MDTFTAISSLFTTGTTGDNTTPSFPEDEEKNSSSGSYCVVAQSEVIDDISDEEKNSSSGSYCIIA